jgi:hypothetical protein
MNDETLAHWELSSQKQTVETIPKTNIFVQDTVAGHVYAKKKGSTIHGLL